MTVGRYIAFGLLLVGSLSFLVADSLVFEGGHRVRASEPAFVPAAPPPAEMTLTLPEKAVLKDDTLASAGIFYPTTEEYLRRQAQDPPYQVAEAFPAPKRPKVFEPFSPLELAQSIETSSFYKRRKPRRFLLSGQKARDEWEPLTIEERKEREEALAKKAVEMGAELADSLSMPYFSSGLLWTTQRLNTYRDYLADEYHLHLDVSEDDAILTYNLEY